MDAKFWHQRWEDNEIAFHVNEANPLLVGYFDRLSLAEGARVSFEIVDGPKGPAAANVRQL